MVTLEARGWLPGERLPRRAGRGRGAAGRAQDIVRVRHGGAWHRARVWSRDALDAGSMLHGPAIVTDPGATLWIAPGWRGRMDRDGTLVLTRGPR